MAINYTNVRRAREAGFRMGRNARLRDDPPELLPDERDWLEWHGLDRDEFMKGFMAGYESTDLIVSY